MGGSLCYLGKKTRGVIVQDDEQAIRQLVSTWLNATANGNAEEVLKLMSDDVVFLVPGRAAMRKTDFIAAQAALKNADIRATAEIQEIKIFGEWAYCWNWLSVTISARDGSAPLKRVGPVLSILRKEAHGWLIFRDANMLAVTEA